VIRIRRAADRGRTELPWLDGRHTFSFGGYHDPRHHHFGRLRVINDDVVAPGGGFDTHPHHDMEIVTVVLDGALRHADSMGNGSVIRPGEVQRMTAGTGVLHSEHNASDTEPVHLLQIWIFPERKGLSPSYEQRAFDTSARAGEWATVASRDGRDASVTIHQDASILRAALPAGGSLDVPVPEGRKAWLHVATGAVRLGDHELGPGDGAAIETTDVPALEGVEDADVLLFDLAR
jgi:redox-sensitive bicupin YhaK (pirin superfamily)